MERDVELGFPEEIAAWYGDHRPEVLAIVDEVVGDFFVRRLHPADFPGASRLSGEYYVAAERFWAVEIAGRPGCYRVSIEVNCLENVAPGPDENRDYLALELLFVWNAVQAGLLFSGDVDSRSI